MKVLTLHAGALKKAILAAAGLGATGATVFRGSSAAGGEPAYSHALENSSIEHVRILREVRGTALPIALTPRSEYYQIISASLLQHALPQCCNCLLILQTYLQFTVQNPIHGDKPSLTHRASMLLAALRRASSQLTSGGTGSAQQHFAAAAATLLSSLATDDDPEAVYLGRRLAGSTLVSWVLSHAVTDGSSPLAQHHAALYITSIMRDPAAARALLSRPKAPQHVLTLAAWSEKVSAAALEALRSARDRNLALEPPARTDLVAVTVAAAQLRQPESQRVLALELLSTWCTGPGSIRTCRVLADARLGMRLAEVAAVVPAQETESRLAISRLMEAIARAAPESSLHLLRLQGWLYPLLCFAADAAGTGDWDVVTASLEAFASCLRRHIELPSGLQHSSVVPLLRRLARSLPGSDGPQPKDTSLRLRAWIAVIHVIQAMAQGEGVLLTVEERMAWADQLLGWLAADGHLDGGVFHLDGMSAAIVDALDSLAEPLGPEGRQVAHAWLAELIVALSRHVQRYGAVKHPSAPGSSGRWWFSRGHGQQTPPQEQDGVAEEATRMLAGRAARSTDAPAFGSALVAPLYTMSQWVYSWTVGVHEPAEKEGNVPIPVESNELPRSSPSDSELALYINAAPVGPAYARAVAADLIEASGRMVHYEEPPATAEELLGPAAAASYAAVATTIDSEVADRSLCQALKVLCALAAGEEKRRLWLVRMGALRALERIVLQHARLVEINNLTATVDAATDVALDFGALPLSLTRQVARLVAVLTADVGGAAELATSANHWLPWLQQVAAERDCKASSCAAKALLHVESAAATVRPKYAVNGQPVPSDVASMTESQVDALRQAAAIGRLLPDPAQALAEDAEPTSTSDMQQTSALDDLGAAFVELKRTIEEKIEEKIERARPPIAHSLRLVLQDGIHLFDPLASHHEALARHGVNDRSSDAPIMDLVFIHGIRGGAFATWRQDGVLEHGSARGNLDRETVWPARWLAPRLAPYKVRLISAEYAAPASAWEGESLPFHSTAEQIAEKLAAAGVGCRPVVFVAHSMGGLLVKEIMSRGTCTKDDRDKHSGTPAQRALAAATVGLVFYSVPHAGSRLADWGWSLRLVGASPARAVAQLTQGPHLDELNAAVRAMARAGLPVLSFSEGKPYFKYVSAPVVPLESAYPGYGEFVVLPLHDHVSVCKPTGVTDPAFSVLEKYLVDRAAEAMQADADRRNAASDHMEAAL